jgi:hypothetical protein
MLTSRGRDVADVALLQRQQDEDVAQRAQERDPDHARVLAAPQRAQLGGLPRGER